MKKLFKTVSLDVCLWCFGFLALGSFSHGASEGGVLFLGKSPGMRDAHYLAAAYLTPPDASHDVDYEIQEVDPDPGQFGQAAVVVIAGLDKKNPKPWTEQQVTQASDWVQAGGTLIFLGPSPVLLDPQGTRFSRLTALLGATKATSNTGATRVATDSSLTQEVKGINYPWCQGGYGLTGLTTATELVGNGQQAIFTSNQVGKGCVYFLGQEVTRFQQSTGLIPLGSLAGRAMLSAPLLKKKPSKREAWKLEPLGKPAPETTYRPAPVQRQASPTLRKQTSEGPRLLLSEKGQARATILISTKASASTQKAAKELSAALAKITGGTFPVEKEDQGRWARQEDGTWKSPQNDRPTLLVVGETQLGEEAGISGKDLPSEGTRLLTRKNVVFLLGSEKSARGIALLGPEFAVSSFLERHAGVRWLWPGELGSVYPRQPDFSVSPMDETDAPAVAMRRMRNLGGGGKRFHQPESVDASVLGAETLEPKGTIAKRITQSLSLMNRSVQTQLARFPETYPWFTRMRLGSSVSLRCTHAFDGWYEKYFASHPEWFALQPTGLRTQRPVREQLCYADPGVVQAAAAMVLKQLADEPELTAASISPNDGSGENFFDMSEMSRRLDPPNAPIITFPYRVGGVSLEASYPSFSDRLCTFYRAVAEEVARQNPAAMVGVSAYSYYRRPPMQVTLPDNVVVAFVGLVYLDDRTLRRDRESWDGWATKTKNLILRPNLFHQGHAMPLNYARRLTSDFRRCYETGLIGTDFDSVLHHWSTQGLNYYVLSRILWDPSLDVNQVIEDYCRAGFGSAASSVRAYFDELEKVTDGIAAGIADTIEQGIRDEEIMESSQTSRDLFFQKIPDFYTEEVLEKLRRPLNQAREKAQSEPEALRRVEFLMQGLEYAEQQRRVFSMYRDEKADPAQARRVIEDRNKFLQSLHDHPDYFFAIGCSYLLHREASFMTKYKVSTQP